MNTPQKKQLFAWIGRPPSSPTWACMTGVISTIKESLWLSVEFKVKCYCFMFKVNPCLFFLIGWRLWRVKKAQRPLFETCPLASVYPCWSRWWPYVCSTWPVARGEQEEHTRWAAVSHWHRETRAECHCSLYCTKHPD